MNAMNRPRNQGDPAFRAWLVRQAAWDAVATHLDQFRGSSERHDMLENHIELDRDEADSAVVAADEMCRRLRNTVREQADKDRPANGERPPVRAASILSGHVDTPAFQAPTLR